MTTKTTAELEAPKRRGRRPKPDGKIARLPLRVNPNDKARWQLAAKASRLSLNAWAEQVMNAQAAEFLKSSREV